MWSTWSTEVKRRLRCLSPFNLAADATRSGSGVAQTSKTWKRAKQGPSFAWGWCAKLPAQRGKEEKARPQTSGLVKTRTEDIEDGANLTTSVCSERFRPAPLQAGTVVRVDSQARSLGESASREEDVGFASDACRSPQFTGPDSLTMQLLAQENSNPFGRHNGLQNRTVTFGASIADSHTSSKLNKAWMNSLNDCLVFFQWGQKAFYNCDLKHTWLAVNETNLQLHTNLIYKKFMNDLTKCAMVLLLTPLTLPIRILVGFPFWRYIINHTRDEDMVNRQARLMWRMTCMLIMMCTACCFSGSILYRAYMEVRPEYIRALNQDGGIISRYELFAPLRSLLVVLVLEVMRKQRRDVAYQANAMRHRVLVDEFALWDESYATLGPLHENQDQLWLLTSAPDNPELTRLEAHREFVEEQLHMLKVGTGAVSEIADNEKDMFYQSGMQDLLEQRLEETMDIESMLLDIEQSGEKVRTIPVHFSTLVELCCAGYPKHFVGEKDIVYDGITANSTMTKIIAFLFASLPTVAALWSGNFWRRLALDGENKIPEVVYLWVLSSACSYVYMTAVLSRLFLASQHLRTACEGFIILQRMVSRHHKLSTKIKEWEAQQAKQKEKFNLTKRSQAVSRMMSHRTIHGERIRPDTLCKNQVRFKASLMRGADCHLDVIIIATFDKVMSKVYGYNLNPRRRSYSSQSSFSRSMSPSEIQSLPGDLSGKDCRHCHSFVELDLHVPDQLRMWWALRKYKEMDLLDLKVATDLVLVLTILLTVEIVGVSLSEILMRGSGPTQVLAAWELVFFSYGLISVLGQCARLNTLLESDGNRLTFINHDLVFDLTTLENRQGQTSLQKECHMPSNQTPRSKRNLASPCRWSSSMPHNGPSLAAANFCGIQSSPSNAVDSKCQVLPDATVHGKKIAKQLLNMYIDHIDRDSHPLRLLGFVINRSFLARLRLFVFSGCLTALTHFVGRTVFAKQGDG